MKPYKNFISKRTLKKLLKLRTDSLPYDLTNKLEILAVKSGIKPAFLNYGGKTHLFRRAALLLDLYYKETSTPPVHFTRRPNVKSSFLKAATDVFCTHQPIWIYQDIQVESMISKCIAGELNEGHILGYPECCIRWHAGNRAPDTESCFRDIEEHIAKNPKYSYSIQGGTEEEMYTSILLRWRTPYPSYVSETSRSYPFVSHCACPSCLSGESKETERLNNQYKELAIKLDPRFAQEIVYYVSEWAKCIRHGGCVCGHVNIKSYGEFLKSLMRTF